jgi:hypothetical protein
VFGGRNHCALCFGDYHKLWRLNVLILFYSLSLDWRKGAGTFGCTIVSAGSIGAIPMTRNSSSGWSKYYSLSCGPH